MPARPPSPFPAVPRFVLRAGRRLHRNHDTRFGAVSFNPGLGSRAARFSPFRSRDGAVVASLYAATSRQAAAFETVFHDIEPTAPFKTVPLADVSTRAVSEIRARRDLILVPLFTPDLKAWGLRRIDLVDTDRASYAETVLWAEAIHAMDPTVEGLIWTSRQCDPDRCLMLFGDRVAPSDFDVLHTRPILGNRALLRELMRFGRRAGIDIVS